MHGLDRGARELELSARLERDGAAAGDVDEAEPNEGTLSYVSPVARALMGKSIGDVVQAGPGEAEIVEIR